METISLIPLDWDSDFFGYKVAKLELNNSTNFSPLSQLQYRLIYVFAPKPIEQLESNLVDKKASFHTAISLNGKAINQGLVIEAFDEYKHSYEELINLTLESGVFSRFAIDKNFINKEYEKLYTKWITNSVDKISAIEVFVAIENSTILGMVTLTKKTDELADIGLLAVAPQARGKRVASSLIEHAKKYALNHGFKNIQVVTQLDNEPAVKLYESTGFELKELTYIYHIWNHDTI